MTDSDKQLLITIIKRHIAHPIIYLFGSRAREDHTPSSDIDIAIDAGQKINEAIISRIRDEIEESIIPFKVDIIDILSVRSDLKKKIVEEGKLWE